MKLSKIRFLLESRYKIAQYVMNDELRMRMKKILDLIRNVAETFHVQTNVAHQCICLM